MTLKHRQAPRRSITLSAATEPRLHPSKLLRGDHILSLSFSRTGGLSDALRISCIATSERGLALPPELLLGDAWPGVPGAVWRTGAGVDGNSFGSLTGESTAAAGSIAAGS
jgi:hypothetical protein